MSNSLTQQDMMSSLSSFKSQSIPVQKIQLDNELTPGQPETKNNFENSCNLQLNNSNNNNNNNNTIKKNLFSYLPSHLQTYILKLESYEVSTKSTMTYNPNVYRSNSGNKHNDNVNVTPLKKNSLPIIGSPGPTSPMSSTMSSPTTPSVGNPSSTNYSPKNATFFIFDCYMTTLDKYLHQINNSCRRDDDSSTSSPPPVVPIPSDPSVLSIEEEQEEINRIKQLTEVNQNNHSSSIYEILSCGTNLNFHPRILQTKLNLVTNILSGLHYCCNHYLFQKNTVPTTSSGVSSGTNGSSGNSGSNTDNIQFSIVHSSIRLDNIFISFDGQAVISDFADAILIPVSFDQRTSTSAATTMKCSGNTVDHVKNLEKINSDIHIHFPGRNLEGSISFLSPQLLPQFYTMYHGSIKVENMQLQHCLQQPLFLFSVLIYLIFTGKHPIPNYPHLTSSIHSAKDSTGKVDHKEDTLMNTFPSYILNESFSKLIMSSLKPYVESQTSNITFNEFYHQFNSLVKDNYYTLILESVKFLEPEDQTILTSSPTSSSSLYYPKNYQIAYKMLKISETIQNWSPIAISQYYLGKIFLDKLKDTTTAIKYFRMAAEHDHPDAQYELGNIYNAQQRADPILPKSTHRAIQMSDSVLDNNDSSQKYINHQNILLENISMKTIEGIQQQQKIQKQQQLHHDLSDTSKSDEDNMNPAQLSLKYYSLASHQGHTKSQYELAEILSSKNKSQTDRHEPVNMEEVMLALKYYHLSADEGNYVKSQYRLGKLYEIGEGGVSQNYELAFYYYYLSANQGNADAQYNLGEMYWYGRGTNQNFSLAMKYHLQSANQGKTCAINNVGVMYAFGLGVKQDYSIAKKYYHLAADMGNSYAMNNLGGLYEHGYGVEQNYKTSMKYYKKAIEKGNSSAQNSLAKMYYFGRGNQATGATDKKHSEDPIHLSHESTEISESCSNDVISKSEPIPRIGKTWVQKNYKSAFKYFKLSADAGNAESQFYVGKMYEKGTGTKIIDYNNAVKYYQMAADQNESQAMYQLAIIFEEGRGVTGHSDEKFIGMVQPDHELSLKYYKLSSNLGNMNALYWLGVIYEEGLNGVECDVIEASKYYQLSANLGHSGAQCNLGLMYKAGKGVECNYEKAFELIKLSADQFDADAEYEVGLLYESGLGVQKNPKLATKYFKSASAHGNVLAKNKIKKESMK
eukprot:TRINITY_DN1520_c0_g2_i4.p1 TRINITY_DN1520_c0_g2~~TRINITY_DN1520_c0_g2_i4.p1  ORF type:complete len:1366 (-),score=368.16 TRINITY_DN1520_c0_g2_i4:89-3664(-)